MSSLASLSIYFVRFVKVTCEASHETTSFLKICQNGVKELHRGITMRLRVRDSQPIERSRSPQSGSVGKQHLGAALLLVSGVYS
jgi:hypothetical protein